jgi:class 3 adenylate cyclase
MAGMDPVRLAGHIFVLSDEKSEWTIQDVRSPSLRGRFVPSVGDTINQGYTTATWWYRVTLYVPAGDERGIQEWALDLQQATLDYVDFYVTRHDGSTESILTGDFRQAAPAQLASRTYAIPLQIGAGEEVTVHIRVQTQGRHQIPLVAWTARRFQAHVAAENLGYGIYFGILLVMALYNLIIYASIRDRTYLYYVLYIASAACFVATFSGHAQQYGNSLFPAAPAWINAGTTLLQILMTLFGTLFGRAFMQTAQHVPRVHRLTTLFVLIALALALLNSWIPYRIMTQLAQFTAVASLFTLLAASIYLSQKGMRTARFYLLAWGVLILGGGLWTLAIYDVLPVTPITLYSWQIGICLDVTILSLALADRINTERRERFAAQKNMQSLKSFLPQRVAELVVGGGDKTLLEPKRRQITVCVIDLRGFTPFSETSAPEDVMNVLREFYEAMGAIVERHGGTVEHFAGDSMLIFFNAPLEIPEPEKQAVQTALEMRAAFEPLRAKWIKLGHELGLGIGIADGYATIGAIGFSGRSQYAAIGAVTNLAARLCSSAAHGEILTTSRVLTAVESVVESESAGEQTIKGFHRPIALARVKALLKQVPTA